MDKNDAKPEKKGNIVMNEIIFCSSILVMTLLSDFKVNISSNFCGLLRKRQLYQKGNYGADF
jgi:hypothetical protein